MDRFVEYLKLLRQRLYSVRTMDGDDVQIGAIVEYGKALTVTRDLDQILIDLPVVVEQLRW